MACGKNKREKEGEKMENCVQFQSTNTECMSPPLVGVICAVGVHLAQEPQLFTPFSIFSLLLSASDPVQSAEGEAQLSGSKFQIS